MVKKGVCGASEGQDVYDVTWCRAMVQRRVQKNESKKGYTGRTNCHCQIADRPLKTKAT